MEFESGSGEKLTHPLEKLMYYAAAVLLLAIASTMLYSVALRYYFNRPPIWSEEVPRMLSVWMVFIGAGIAIKRGLNVRVEYFVNMMTPSVRRWVETVMHAIALGLIGVMFVYSFPVIELSLGGRLLSTGWSNAVFTIPLPIGCAIMFWYQLGQLRKSWRSSTARP